MAQGKSVSDRVIGRWEQVGRKIVGLAEEIPETQFDYRPTEGVRTVDEVLRHVAFWNRYVADSALGKKADDTANELPKAGLSTKAQVIDALRRSVTDATDALNRSPCALSPEMTEMVVTFIEHNSEHYGQLVVYARLNSIPPPASCG